MLAHDFICTKTENITFALQYYPQKRLLREEMKHVSVKDRWIREYHRFFDGLLLFSDGLEKKVNRLEYYGITLIPPESSRELLERIKKEGFLARMKLRKLVNLLCYASTNCLFIVHYGI
ncbi:MAG: hypothetical protein J6023_05950 [Clostridia bacterium]|nr:hypothetical protein [Clostridia bacterium]